MFFTIFLTSTIITAVLFFKYVFSWRTFNAILSIVYLKDDDLVKDELYELSFLSATEIVQKRNYPVEIHKVTTEDGYILEMHRMPGGKNKNGPDRTKSPVFLMHGLQANSVQWILLEDALAYQLADLGYDVWIGNVRGTNYSTSHKHLNINSSKFWDFTINEISIYDAAAMIDHILAKTGHKSLYYVGSSQGTAAGFILLSKKPEYNEKMRLVVCFTPVLYQKNNIPFRVLAHPATQIIMQALSYLFGEKSLFSTRNLNKKRRVLFAHHLWKSNSKQILNFVFWLMGKPNLDNYDLKIFPLVLSHAPVGGSCKQLRHYGQIVRTGIFGEYMKCWDYWTGKPKPYDIKNIRAPCALFYCKNDRLVRVEDVETTAKLLPNVVFKHLVPDAQGTHLDHILAQDANETHYKHVISLFNKY